MGSSVRILNLQVLEAIFAHSSMSALAYTSRNYHYWSKFSTTAYSKTLIWQFVSKIGHFNRFWKLHGHLPKLKWQLLNEAVFHWTIKIILHLSHMIDYWLGIQIRNMKMVFNIYGTWRWVTFEKLMMKINDSFYSAKSFSNPV